MKREAIRRGLAVLLFTAAVLPGCDSSEPVATERSELAREIVNMGFRPDMIAEFEDHFLVEGDIRIDKADLKKRIGGTPKPIGRPGDQPRYQWVTDNRVTASKISYLNVYIDPSVNSAWASATRTAMTYWGNISNTAIRFVETSPANIVVSMAEVSGNPIAQAQFPTASSDPGGTVTIDLSYASWGNSSQKLYVMAHELGHTIGFRHTNWQTVDSCGLCGIGANQVSGTPQTDGSSVMNGATGGTSWAGFSHYDQVAARTLYPAPPAPTVTSVTTNPSPPTQYLSFTLTVTGSGFDPATAVVIVKPPYLSSCSTDCEIPDYRYSSKTSTQLVAGLQYSVAGTYEVTVRNGPKGNLSSPRQFTIQSMY